MLLLLFFLLSSLSLMMSSLDILTLGGLRHGALGGLLADRRFLAPGFPAEGGDLSLGYHPNCLSSGRWGVVVEFHCLGQTFVGVHLGGFKGRGR